MIQRWLAADRNESSSSGMPKPSPNQKNVPSLPMASPAVSDRAKMLTSSGPEQGRAIGP
jgi:hypothetical protein